MLNFRHIGRRILRRRILLIAGILAYLLWYICFTERRGLDALVSLRTNSKTRPGDRLFSFLYDAVRRCEPIKRPDVNSLRDPSKCRAGDIPFNPAEIYSRGSYENLDSCLHLSDAQLTNLRNKHSDFVELARAFVADQESEPLDLFENDAGIVTVGGGKFSVLSMIMIEMLREKGSKLPVEVLIPPSDEGDDEFCEYILGLNARCVYFLEVLPKNLIGRIPIQGYQFKIMALLMSSFKEVLFLDADNMPLVNPDPIFQQSIFRETGLIVWPDIWRRVTSPAFYQVANIKIDLQTRVRYMGDDITPTSRYQDQSWTRSDMLSLVPMHDLKGAIPDPTSESGQLLVNKTKHLSTLLLAAYYNLNAEWYFRMLSQGTSGEGDKETFIAAAHSLGEPYYQVKTGIKFDGFFDEDGGYHGICLYQFNPQQDYDQHAYATRWMAKHEDEYSTYDKFYNVHKDFYDFLMKPREGNPIDAMFGHASFHKFEPLALAKERTYVDRAGRHFRGFKRFDITKGFDVELFNYDLLHRKLCGNDPLHFKVYKSKMHTTEWTQMCHYLEEHIKFLHDTHYLAASGQAQP